MNNIFPILKTVALTIVLFATIYSQGLAQTLIPINASQVFAETNAETLFDGDLENHWSAGWDLEDYPAFAYVDLGGSYELSEIELYDFAGDGQFKVFAGSPDNWDYDAIAVDDLKNYNVWSSHALDVTTTHLLFRIKTPRSRVGEIRIYGTEEGGTNNEEISFNVPSSETVMEGASKTISIQATNATILTTSSLPDFISFTNLLNGNGTFNIQPGIGDAGTYTITITASNGNGQTKSTTIVITVEGETNPGPGPTVGEETLCEITASQLIVGEGDPGKLVDEQDIIDDPANGPGGNPLSFWFPGWKTRFYPAEGYLDLGSVKTLTRIFLRDITGTGNFKIYAGAPGEWESTPIVDDNLQAYLSWTEHTTPVRTRYLKVVMDDASSKVGELAIYGFCDGEPVEDIVAPAQVVNLSASNVTSQSIRLNWVSTGDDGNVGTASNYDLRYSLSPINGSNFSNATTIPTSTPQPAGTDETKTVLGLNCGTTYYFSVRVIDEAGNASPPSNIVSRTTATCGIQPEKQITLTLSQPVGSVNISKSTLKYNKDFAYSFTVDDGSIWDYYMTYQIINGGESGFPPNDPEQPWFDFPDDPHIQEDGFSYDDGCGNDVKFKGGLALNTKNATNNVTDYHITWDNIIEVFNNDWDIFGHGHTHCSSGCNYDENIGTNTDLLEEYLGFLPTHFVVPSGNNDYWDAAFDNGKVAVYDQNINFPGFEGLRVDEELDYNEFLMYRYPIEVSDPPYGDDLDQVVSLTEDGSHYWITEFTHAVGHPHGGEYNLKVEYNDFKTYMSSIETQYGKPWSDKKVWMAPMQEVYEYMRVRDAVEITNNNQGNTVTIFIDDEDVPSGLRRHALSLIVNLPNGVSITDVVPTDMTVESYNPETGLLNLRWD